MMNSLGTMQVLTTAESNKGLIRIDPLQRLHTLTNLSELLASGVQGIAHTLRDDQLQAQAEEIRQASSCIYRYFSFRVTSFHQASISLYPCCPFNIPP